MDKKHQHDVDILAYIKSLTKGIVNRHFIHSVLNPLCGGADIDEECEKYASLDINDSATVKERVICPIIVPYVRRFDEHSLARVKLALAYGLSDPATRFDRIFHSMLTPLEAPANPRDLFVWIWEECFPGESYTLNIRQYEVHDDFEEPGWRIKLKPEEQSHD